MQQDNQDLSLNQNPDPTETAPLQTESTPTQPPFSPTKKPKSYEYRLRKMSNAQVRGEIRKYAHPKKGVSVPLGHQALGVALDIVFDNTKYTNPRAKSDGALR